MMMNCENDDDNDGKDNGNDNDNDVNDDNDDNDNNNDELIVLESNVILAGDIIISSCFDIFLTAILNEYSYASIPVSIVC